MKGHGDRGWDVSVRFWPQQKYGQYMVSLHAEQNGGPLKCDLHHYGHGKTLADAIENLETAVGNASPDFAAAHEARKPKASIVSGTTPAGRREPNDG
jgi:hypothetical protein